MVEDVDVENTRHVVLKFLQDFPRYSEAYASKLLKNLGTTCIVIVLVGPNFNPTLLSLDISS